MPSSYSRFAAVASVLTAAVLLAACGRDAGEAPPAAAPAGDVAPGHTTTDEAITADIRLRLARDTTLAGLDVQIITRDGRVLLRGIAPDTAVRSQVAELARSVAGVVEVNNDLSVQMTHK